MAPSVANEVTGDGESGGRRPPWGWAQSGWLSATARWGLWVVGPGPRIWWRLFDHSKSSAVASVLVQTLATLLTVLAARLLGQEQYGELATLSTSVGWFGMLASYPTASLGARFIAQGRQGGEPWERKCAAALALSAAFACAASAIGGLLLPVLLRSYGVPHLRTPALLLCLGLLFAPPAGFSVYVLQAVGRMKQWAALNLILGAMPIAAVLTAAALGTPLDVTRYVGATVAAGAASAALGLVISGRLLGWGSLLHPDLRAVPSLLRAGVGGWIAVLSCTLAVLAIQTMIASYVGRTELGHYQLVGAIGTWVYAVNVSVSVPTLAGWSALAAAGQMRRLRRSLRLHQTGTASLSILASAVGLAAAPEILEWLYGEAYRSSATILRISTVAWVSLGFGSWYWISFAALGHPGRVMVPNLLWGGVQLVTAWTLLRGYGLGVEGAMVAYALAYIAWALGYEVLFRRSLASASAP